MEHESQNAQDARVERLWESLHTGPIKPLDLEGLRLGLRKIDHRKDLGSYPWYRVSTNPRPSSGTRRELTP